MANGTMRIFVTKQGANMPQYESKGAAGMDLAACLDSPITIEPGDIAMVPTGLSIALPTGHEAQVRPRSGLAAKHGITVLNSPGTIDEDYRGEIKVILINHSRDAFVINHGERIAQLVIAGVTQVDVLEVESADALGETDRGAGGFGSTGR